MEMYREQEFAQVNLPKFSSRIRILRRFLTDDLLKEVFDFYGPVRFMYKDHDSRSTINHGSFSLPLTVLYSSVYVWYLLIMWCLRGWERINMLWGIKSIVLRFDKCKSILVFDSYYMVEAGRQWLNENELCYPAALSKWTFGTLWINWRLCAPREPPGLVNTRRSIEVIQRNQP